MWDAVMNYHFTRACVAFFIGDTVDETELKKTSLFPTPSPGAESLRTAIERLIGLYHPNVTSVMLNLLGSHDTPRYLTLARNDLSSLRMATMFQMTYPGAPSIYYGDEIGMAGGHDPANRGAFPWHDPKGWNTDLLHEFQRLIALRQTRAALRRGSYQIVHAEGDVFVHVRKLGDEVVVCGFNVGSGTQRLNLPADSLLPDGGILETAWEHETHKVEQGAIRNLEIPPRSGRIWLTPLHND
jgi:neopullulanase